VRPITEEVKPLFTGESTVWNLRERLKEERREIAKNKANV